MTSDELHGDYKPLNKYADAKHYSYTHFYEFISYPLLLSIIRIVITSIIYLYRIFTTPCGWPGTLPSQNHPCPAARASQLPMR